MKITHTNELIFEHEIMNQFDKLTYKKKTGVLFTAIDYMEQYNGRSKVTCIALAMGYDHEPR